MPPGTSESRSSFLVVSRHAFDRVKERLQVATGMLGILGSEARLLVGVVHVVARIPWAGLPVVCRIVEAVPDLDLHNNRPLGGPLQHVLKTLPVFLVPLIEVELPVRQQLVRLEILALALAHRIADVVGSNRLDLIEMLLEPLQQKDMVCLAAAQEHHRLALILPVAWVHRVRLDPIRVLVFGRRRRDVGRGQEECSSHNQKRNA